MPSLASVIALVVVLAVTGASNSLYAASGRLIIHVAVGAGCFALVAAPLAYENREMAAPLISKLLRKKAD